MTKADALWTLRVDLNADERDGDYDAVAYEFHARSDGGVYITEILGEHTEHYSDEFMIFIPARVWNIAAPWIEAALRARQESEHGDQ